MRWVKRWRVHLSVRHLYGPKEIAYAPDELVVVCLVRDGRPYIRSFIEHHLSLGAKHIIFLDNGSTDDTVAVAKEHEHVTVIQSRLPFKQYEYTMKQYLISRFGKGRWTLYADIDELFDYPYSDVVSLRSLLRYLNERSYTAVVAQMLDMFPDRALSTQISQEDEPLKELYRFYDISSIEKEDYGRRRGRRSNVAANDDIKVFHGGIRKDIFDANFMLTKHPLMFLGGEARHKNNDNGLHSIRNARIADFSCVLYHYKLVDGFQERAARAAREENYALATFHYKRYHELLERNPGDKIWKDTARELGSVNELIDNGFLVVSDEYREWAEKKKKKKKKKKKRNRASQS
jgi:Glycosyl transferase family 2